MTTKISPREWEALSAYLDGALSFQERTRLEARLEENPDMRSALQDMRRTRAVLNSAPMLRAPRNFTLTPQMAGIRPGERPVSGAYPVLRLASLLATIFFLVVFVGDLAIRTIQPASFQVARSPQHKAAPPSWPPVGMGGGGGGDDEGPRDALEAPAEQVTVVVEAEKVVEIQAGEPEIPEEEKEQPAPLAADSGRSVINPTMTPAPTPTPWGTSQPPLNQVVPAPGEIPPPEGAFGQTLGPTPVMIEPVAASPDWSILGILQILLAVMALGTGMGAIYLHRSARR